MSDNPAADADAAQAAAGDVTQQTDPNKTLGTTPPAEPPVEQLPPDGSVADTVVAGAGSAADEPQADTPPDDGPVDEFHAAQRDLRQHTESLLAAIEDDIDAAVIEPVCRALAGVGDAAVRDLHRAVRLLMRGEHAVIHAVDLDILSPLRLAWERVDRLFAE